MSDAHQYTPKGHHTVEDADGERWVKNKPAQMTQSMTYHWSQSECRAVLDRLLAEKKENVCSIQDLPSGSFMAWFSIYADHISQGFKTKSEAQAWIDQQWKDYVERMNDPIPKNQTP